jgi:membrane protease YdiL (CAAX protease family)
MTDVVIQASWRQKTAVILNTKWAAVVEIVLVLLITAGHRVFHIIPIDETLVILALGWLSLWLRGIGWKGVGFRRPKSWVRVILVGIAVGAFLQILSEYVTEPLIQQITGKTADLSEFKPLVGNLKLSLLMLAAVWSLAAFGEELTYRGYLLNRVADLTGKTSFGWIAGLLFITILFGFGHSYQGWAGMLDTGIHGFLLGILYLVSGRNLWPCIIAHGATDTIGLTLVFLGHF